MLFAVIAIATIAGGCATAYQSSGFTGGYKDAKLDENTYRVSFQGNGMTSRETVEIYGLYRCAELTVERGFDYFISIDGADGSTVTAGGGFAVTHFAVSRTIKLFKGTKPADSEKAFDARELMKNLEAEVK